MPYLLDGTAATLAWRSFRKCRHRASRGWSCHCIAAVPGVHWVRTISDTRNVDREGSQEEPRTHWDFSKAIRALRRPEEFLEFFAEKQVSLRPADICLLLEGLWKSTLTHHGLQVDNPHSYVGGGGGRGGGGSKLRTRFGSSAAEAPQQLQSARKQLFNSAEFMQMLKDIVWKLHAFSPRDLPRLLTALEDMRWNDRHLFKVAEPMVIRHMPKISIHDIPQLTQTYVSVYCGSRQLFDQIIHRTSQAEEGFSSSALTTMILAFAHAPHKPKAFLLGVSGTVASQFRSFTSEELAHIVDAYAHKCREVPTTFLSALVDALTADESEHLRTWSAQEMVLLVAAVPVLGEKRSFQLKMAAALFPVCESVLLSEHKTLQAGELCRVLWAFEKMRQLTGRLFKVCYEELVPICDRARGDVLARALLASARVLTGETALLAVAGDEAGVVEDVCDRSDTRLLDQSEETLQQSASKLGGAGLAAALRAYALLGTGSPKLLAVLQRACMEACHELPTDQATTLLWSFSTLRLGPAFCKEVQIDLLDRLHQLSTPEVCDILWSYCVARHYDPKFMTTLMKMLTPSKVHGDPRCSRLYPALLEVRAQFPDMDPAALNRYASYTEQGFRELQERAFSPPASAVKDLVSCLEALSLQHEVCSFVEGYLCDILVRSVEKEGHGKPVVVLWHSHHTLHKRTGEPLGYAIMRQRQLKRSGHGVVNLLATSWQAMDEQQKVATLEAKVLQAMLKPEGAAKDRETRTPANV